MNDDYKLKSKEINCITRNENFFFNPKEEAKTKRSRKKSSQVELEILDDGKNEETWDYLQDRILRVLTYKCNEQKQLQLLENENRQTKYNISDDEEEIETHYLQNFTDHDYVPIEFQVIPSLLPTAEYAEMVHIPRDTVFMRICRCLRDVCTLRLCRNR